MSSLDAYEGKLLPVELRGTREAAASFFGALYGPALGRSDLFCEVRPQPTWNADPAKGRSRDPLRQWVSLADAQAGARVAEVIERTDAAVARRTDKRSGLPGQVYYAVNPRRSEGGLRQDCMGYVAVYADLELRKAGVAPVQAIQRLAALPAKPSAAVWSGNGMHAYWFFDRLVSTLDQARVERLVTGVALHLRDLGADTKVFDASRILRPPATHNRKGGLPGKPTLLLMLSPSRRYGLRQLEQTYPGPMPGDVYKVHTPDAFGPASLPDFYMGPSWHVSVLRHLTTCRQRGASDSEIQSRATVLGQNSPRKGGEAEAARIANWVVQRPAGVVRASRRRAM